MKFIGNEAGSASMASITITTGRRTAMIQIVRSTADVAMWEERRRVGCASMAKTTITMGRRTAMILIVRKIRELAGDVGGPSRVASVTMAKITMAMGRKTAMTPDANV